jgi:hypothetical protein
VPGQIGSDHGMGAGERRNQVSPGLPRPSQPVNEEQDPRSGPRRCVGEIATGELHPRFMRR